MIKQIKSHVPRSFSGLSESDMSKSQTGPSTASTRTKPKSILNKKERQNIVESIKGMTDAQVIDTVVKHLSEALHMQ